MFEQLERALWRKFCETQRGNLWMQMLIIVLYEGRAATWVSSQMIVDLRKIG
jgi:hypothetical protein